MGVASFLRDVYDVDTLDTRFTTSSSVPYRTVIEARGDGPAALKKQARPANQPDPNAQPSKWNTPEFYFYTITVGFLVPYMFWIAYDVSRPSDPRYPKFEKLLSPGWIPGRMIDNSDNQYATFRENLPYMGLLLVLHPLCRKLWNAMFPLHPNSGAGKNPAEQADARLEQRASFDYTFALVFLVALHGVSAAKILFLLWLNYQVATNMPRKYVPILTWTFNIAVLFANELCSGYKFKNMAMLFQTVDPTNISAPEGFLVQWGGWLDSWGGIVPRWEIQFNITILRLISFNMDRYWSHDQRGGNLVEKQLDPANLSERDRVAIPARTEDFSFRNYIAYAIYAPLYLAGPIITFNDFISQLRHRAASIETPRTIRYGVRFALTLLAMEVILHYDYVAAISAASPVWDSYTPAQLALLSYFKLHLIWLKLLLIWRLFRLWSLVDGIDPPENMLRCVSDNFSTLRFWRAWHRSYNRWLIRYLYVPLGGADFRSWVGAARSVLTYVLVFTFVALWHDISLHLLIWGWLVVLFFIPEIAGGYIFPARKWASRPTAYRMLCCVGAVGNVLMMMSANLVGFAVGLDGLESILAAIFHEWSGLLFLAVASGALFMGVQIMFEIRESELRRGISLRC